MKVVYYCEGNDFYEEKKCENIGKCDGSSEKCVKEYYLIHKDRVEVVEFPNTIWCNMFSIFNKECKQRICNNCAIEKMIFVKKE